MKVLMIDPITNEILIMFQSIKSAAIFINESQNESVKYVFFKIINILNTDSPAFNYRWKKYQQK